MHDLSLDDLFNLLQTIATADMCAEEFFVLLCNADLCVVFLFSKMGKLLSVAVTASYSPRVVSLLPCGRIKFRHLRTTTAMDSPRKLAI